MARKPATDTPSQDKTNTANGNLPRRPSTSALSVKAPERHFAVPEFKVSTVQRDRSFVLGYN